MIFRKKPKRINKMDLYYYILTNDKDKINTSLYNDFFEKIKNLFPNEESFNEINKKEGEISSEDFIKSYFSNESDYISFHIKDVNGVPRMFFSFYEKPTKHTDILTEVSFFNFSSLPS